MSIRHLQEMQNHFGDDKNWAVPIPQVLALSDDLQFAHVYDPCAFGTPGGAPRQLGQQNPVVVDDKFTYVYVQDGKVAAYFKLVKAQEYKLLFVRSFTDRVGIAMTSSVLSFETREQAEFAFQAVRKAMPGEIVRLYE